MSLDGPSWADYERDFKRAELVPGDLIFRRGRFGKPLVPGWKFLGIPGTGFGISYYFVTGREDAVQYDRLVALVSPA